MKVTEENLLGPDFDADDEEMSESPPEVVAGLGFDPLDIDDLPAEDAENALRRP